MILLSVRCSHTKGLNRVAIFYHPLIRKHSYQQLNSTCLRFVLQSLGREDQLRHHESLGREDQLRHHQFYPSSCLTLFQGPQKAFQSLSLLLLSSVMLTRNKCYKIY